MPLLWSVHAGYMSAKSSFKNLTEVLVLIDQLQTEIDKLRPLDPDSSKELKQYFNIGLTYSSNALEGNSLTESETKVVIEDGLTIGGRPIKDHSEALGHSEAYNHLYSLVNETAFSTSDIKKLHRLFYYRIDEQEAGKWRKRKVFLSGSKYSLPNNKEIPSLIKEFCSWVSGQLGQLHPVELAAEVHRRFVFIHPFIDGNGRVGRLLMNLILLQNGYTIGIIPPILRAEYIRLLELSHVEVQPFNLFIAERVMETQRDYLRLLK